MAEKKITQKTIQAKQADSEKRFALWLIGKANTASYRAGSGKNGSIHPKINGKVYEAVGGRNACRQQAKTLAKEGLLRLDPPVLTDLMELKAIHFDLSDMPRLCEWVGIADPKKQQEIQIEKIQTFQEEVSDTFLYGYYEDILERLRTGQLVKDPNLGDELFFHFLNAMAKNESSIWKRVFSAYISGSSKIFEQNYEKRVCTVLRLSPLYEEGMENEDLLKAYGILTYSQTLEWKGALVYRLDKTKHSGDVSVLTCADTGVIDTSENVWGTVLNAQTLEHSECIELPGVKQILIIENKANYEAMPYRKDTLYLYCHGFFSPKEISFLKKIPEIYPEMNVFHWGDMDYGGMRIFEFNRTRLFPRLKPWKMDTETYEKALSDGAGIDLNEEKRKKLEQFETEMLRDLKEYILKYGKEIEQERLLLRKKDK